MGNLTFTVDTDGIATITLDNPDGPMNVVSPEWIDEFAAAVEKIATTAAIKGAIVTSAKPAFMAGADLKYLVGSLGRMTVKDAYAFSQNASAMHRRMETCGKPFAAAINGVALGGGFELCLACHYRVLADDAKAVVGLPEVTVGLLPGSGGTQRLPRLVGVSKALPLLLDGKSLAPGEALKLGLVHETVPATRLIDAARAWILHNADPVQPWDKKGFALPESAGLLSGAAATTFGAQVPLVAAKTNHNYPAPIAILSCVFEGVQMPFDAGLRIESKYFATLLTDPVARNIIRATFLNKGLAEKLTRRPDGIAKASVKKLGVLGAGMMGSGIAHVAAVAGMDVVLLDSSLELAEKGKANAARILKKEVEKGTRDQAKADAVLARITPAADYASLAGSDLVVEAVFEDRAIKAKVTGQAEAVLAKTAIFATNTSTLPISGLAEASSRPENFIGLHFFSPVERMALVEVIVGKKTSQATLAHALDFVAQLRKTPIVVNDSRGFYTSRVFQTFIHEGAAMLGEGIAPARIENAAKHAGMPVGPLALLDEVTLELPMQIVKQAQAEDGDRYEAPCGTAVMRRMLELKRGGRRFGGGFYEYPQGTPKQIWSGLSDTFPVAAAQPDTSELRKRFLYIQAMETARCLEEGVLTHPADGDLGAVLGWGFPSYTGGTLSLIDTVGLASFVSECDRLAQACGPRFKPSTWLRARATRNEAFYA